MKVCEKKEGGKRMKQKYTLPFLAKGMIIIISAMIFSLYLFLIHYFFPFDSIDTIYILSIIYLCTMFFILFLDGDKK